MNQGQPIAKLKDIDYRALRYLMTRTEGPRLSKKMALQRFDKAWRQGNLYVPQTETQDQKWWRCEARFLLGDYSDWGGWQYRDPFATRVWFENPFKCRVWDGGRVSHLALVGEQGLGDEIFFSSVLPSVMEKVDQITIESEPRLQSVFERSFGVKTVTAKMRFNEEREGLERVLQEPLTYNADAWATMADMGRIFRHTESHFHREPYITAAADQVERFKSLRGRVGISWRGAQGEIPLKLFLKEFPSAISLQYDQSWDEDIERPDVDLKQDVEGIFGVLANLERVVCVSTTVAHFASAMGVPTEVRLAPFGTGRRSHLIPWKWVNRANPGQSLWYPKSTKTVEALF